MGTERGPAIGPGVGPTFLRNRRRLVCPGPGCEVLKVPGIIVANSFTLDMPGFAATTLYGGNWMALGDAGCFNVAHGIYLQNVGDPVLSALGLPIGYPSPTWNQQVLEGPTPGAVGQAQFSKGDWESLSPPAPATVQIAVVSLSCGGVPKGDFAESFVFPPVLYKMEEASGNRLDWYGYHAPLVPQGTVTTVPGRVGSLAAFTAGDINGNGLISVGVPTQLQSNWAFAFWHKPSSANPFNGFGSPLWVGGDGTAAASNLFRVFWTQDQGWIDRVDFQVSDGAAWIANQIEPAPPPDVWYAVVGRAGPGYTDIWIVSDDGTFDEHAGTTGLTPNATPSGGWGSLNFTGGAARVGGAVDELFIWPGIAPTKEQMLAKIGWVAP